MAGKVIRTVAVKVRADISDFEKNFQKSQKIMVDTANKMKSIGKTMATSITLPVAAVATAGTKMAMNFQNSSKQIENNLKSSAKSVNNWVENNARAFNMAKVDASQYAATYSNLLSGFLNENQNADFTKALLQQSSVIGNKTGRNIDDVMERIRSGLLGSTEAIEDLGINVNVALLETTDAFKKIAGNKSWDKLSFQAQQQIRLFAILEQSMKKYGTTIDQNATSKLQGNIAKMKDLGLTIGQKLLPHVIKLLDWGNKILDWLSNLDPQMQNTIMVVAGLAAAAGPLLIVVGNLVTGFTALTPVIGALVSPVGIVTIAVVALAAKLSTLGEANSKVTNAMGSDWDNLSKSISKSIQGILKSFYDYMSSPMTGAIEKSLQRLHPNTDLHISSSNKAHGGASSSFGQSWSAGQIYAEREKEKAAQRAQKSTSATNNWLNSLMDGFKGAETAGVETYDKLNDSVKSFIDSLKSQTDAYMNFVGVFDSANNDMVISGERWISRLKGQLKATQTYQQSMAFLQGKAQSGVISNQLMSQLQSMGVGSAAQLQALSKMSDSQLRQASDLYGQRYNLSSDMAYDSVMRSRSSEAATNQIVVNITGNNIMTEDDAVINKWTKKIAKELKAAGMA